MWPTIKQRSKDQGQNRQAGFTMLEILVVMIIIAVLVTLGLSSFRSAQIKSRDSKRVSDLKQVARALETYYSDKGHYPVSTGDGKIKAFYDNNGNGDIEDGESMIFEWGNKFYDPVHTSVVYMGNLPYDTNTNKCYFYEAYHRDYDIGNEQYDVFVHEDSEEPDNYEAEGYRIYARLDNEENSKVMGDFSGTDCNPDLDMTDACNYVVTSQNMIISPTP